MCIYGYLFYTLIIAGLLSYIYARSENKSENYMICRLIDYKSN